MLRLKSLPEAERIAESGGWRSAKRMMRIRLQVHNGARLTQRSAVRDSS